MKQNQSVPSGLSIALYRAWERLRRWLHLLWLQRERAALEVRRDHYLIRLGQKTYAEMRAKGPDLLPSASETYLDVRAVQDRLDQVERQMEALRGPIAPPGPRLPVVPGARQPAGAGTPGNGQVSACPCGAALAAGSKFCSECGLPVGSTMPNQPSSRRGGGEPRRTCPRCGGFVPLMTDHCPTCQAPAVSWTLDEE